MRNETLERAMDIINHSSLSPEDRSTWKEILAATPGAFTDSFVELAEDPKLLTLMTSSVKRKKDIFKSGGSFNAILAEELQLLETEIRK